MNLVGYQEGLPMAKVRKKAGDQVTQASAEVSWAGYSRFRSGSESVLLSFEVILSAVGYIYIQFQYEIRESLPGSKHCDRRPYTG